jgi:hypothetical protein
VPNQLPVGELISKRVQAIRKRLESRCNGSDRCSSRDHLNGTYCSQDASETRLQSHLIIPAGTQGDLQEHYRGRTRIRRKNLQRGRCLTSRAKPLVGLGAGILLRHRSNRTMWDMSLRFREDLENNSYDVGKILGI